MYLHKEGCQYYMKIFELAGLRANFAIESEKRNNVASPTAKALLGYDGVDVREDLIKLYEHTQNIEKKIGTEEDVLKTLMNTIHREMIVGKNLQGTDPQMTNLMKVIQELSYIHNMFATLKKAVDSTMSIYKEEGEVKNALYLRDQYVTISNNLNDIFRKSTLVANKLTDFIKVLDKEKEWIQKEEVAATDFNKNLMSWF